MVGRVGGEGTTPEEGAGEVQQDGGGRVDSSRAGDGVNEGMGGVQQVGHGGKGGWRSREGGGRRMLMGWCLQTAVWTWVREQERSIRARPLLIGD